MGFMLCSNPSNVVSNYCVTVSQYQESQELQFSRTSMVLKIQEDSALNRFVVYDIGPHLGICFYGVSEDGRVFQQYKATPLLCCLDLASTSCKTSLGPRNEHASCWFICFVASLVQLAERISYDSDLLS